MKGLPEMLSWTLMKLSYNEVEKAKAQRDLQDMEAAAAAEGA